MDSYDNLKLVFIECEKKIAIRIDKLCKIMNQDLGIHN